MTTVNIDPERTTDTPVAAPRPSLRSHGGEIFSRYALILVWLAMACLYLALKPDTFGSFATVRAIFGSQAVLLFLAFSALVTLIVGEFDLSFASVMGLGATIIPVLSEAHGVPLPLACLIAVVACCAAEGLNAFLIVGLGVPSLVITLGTGTLLIGIAEVISSSTSVYLNRPGFTALTQHHLLGMPLGFYYGLALTLAFAYICAFTPLGRKLLFVGSSPEVARLAGIRVNRIRAGSYVTSGLLAGIAAIMLTSSVGGYDPTAPMTYLLPALSAVFLGTAVVLPGQFNPIGTLIGIYFLATGIFGLQLLGFTGWIQDAFYGGGLALAVTIAHIVRRRAKTA